MEFQVPVYETVVVKRVYVVEADTREVALVKAEAGETVSEETIESCGVINREAGVVESTDWAQSNKTMAPLEGFEVVVSVTLQVDPIEEPHTHKQLRDTALDAITHCVRYAEQNGFAHKLAADVSIGVRDIEVTDTF